MMLWQYSTIAMLVWFDRLALRILNNSQEAEDLTQEIFINFWNKPIYNPDRSSLSTFLTTVTRSRAIDRIRSRGSNMVCC